MTRKLSAVDRAATLVTGALLLAGGLALVDWRTGRVLDAGPRLDLSPSQDAVGSAWWSWAAAVVGVVLALVGLRWLLAHVPTPGPGTARLGLSDSSGSVEVDLRALGRSVGDRWRELAPVSSYRVRTSRGRASGVVEVTGRLDEHADADTLVSGAHRCATEVREAFGDDVHLRLLVARPRRALARPRPDRIRL